MCVCLKELLQTLQVGYLNRPKPEISTILVLLLHVNILFIFKGSGEVKIIDISDPFWQLLLSYIRRNPYKPDEMSSVHTVVWS